MGARTVIVILKALLYKSKYKNTCCTIGIREFQVVFIDSLLHIYKNFLLFPFLAAQCRCCFISHLFLGKGRWERRLETPILFHLVCPQNRLCAMSLRQRDIYERQAFGVIMKVRVVITFALAGRVHWIKLSLLSAEYMQKQWISFDSSNLGASQCIIPASISMFTPLFLVITGNVLLLRINQQGEKCFRLLNFMRSRGTSKCIFL